MKKNKVHALLTSYGIIIKATDPFGKNGLREIENNYKKTDREDSFQLADVYRKGGMKGIYIPSGEIENIRSLVRYRHSLGEEITLKKNKIHALLTSYGIIIKATDPFGKKD